MVIAFDRLGTLAALQKENDYHYCSLSLIVRELGKVFDSTFMAPVVYCTYTGSLFCFCHTDLMTSEVFQPDQIFIRMVLSIFETR